MLRAPRADLRFVVATCPSSASRHIARHLRVYIREGCVANLSVSSVTATVFAISSSAPPSSPSHTHLPAQPSVLPPHLQSPPLFSVFSLLDLTSLAALLQSIFSCCLGVQHQSLLSLPHLLDVLTLTSLFHHPPQVGRYNCQQASYGISIFLNTTGMTRILPLPSFMMAAHLFRFRSWRG